MATSSRWTAGLLAVLGAVAGCDRETDPAEPDVYVAGVEEGARQSARLWRNGVPQPLDDTYEDYAAVLWTDGRGVKLSDPGVLGNALGIAVVERH